MCDIVALLAFCVALGLKKYSLQRTIVRQGAKEDTNKDSGSHKDLEKGSDSGTAEHADSDDEGQGEKVKEEVKGSGAIISSKTTDELSVRPATGTTLGASDSADGQR